MTGLEPAVAGGAPNACAPAASVGPPGGVGPVGAGVPALSRATVDRAAHRRTDERWLSQAARSPTSRAFAVAADGRVLVTETDAGPRLVVGPAGAVAEAAGAGDGELIFLGEEPADGEAAAVVWFAVPVDRVAAGADRRPMTLREVGADLPDREAGLLVHAVALRMWHATHRYCPRCGEATVSVAGGSARRCSAEGDDHFPRTDPAVIMLVHDGADRAVLGRSPAWPPGRLSVLAGFVEAGESAEQAVAREVLEEVGLPVRDVRYVVSQPWPFPRSLMLAFTARADRDDIVIDPIEIEDAGWWTRAELTGAIARRDVLVPPAASVARMLIDGWLAGRLADD